MTDPTVDMTIDDMEKMAVDAGWNPIVMNEYQTVWFKNDQADAKTVREVCRIILGA